MLTAEQVLEAYFLESRCMLLEIAAVLDRLDAAVDHDRNPAALGDPRLEKIYQSLAILAERGSRPGRAEQLLTLFSDPIG